MKQLLPRAWWTSLWVVSAAWVASCGGRTGELLDLHPDASLAVTSSSTGVGTGPGATTGTSGSGTAGATGSSGTTGPVTVTAGTGGASTTTTGAGGTSTTTGAGGAGGAGTGGRSTTTGVGGRSMTGGAAGSGAGGAGGSPACGPNNCKGCCDAVQRCRTGTDLDACGALGAQCLDCGASGFACTANRTCEGVAPPCGPMTCSGCCSADGLCRFGNQSDTCGLGGVKCVDCSATGQACLGGQCAGTPPKCGPGNCGGCCDALGKCQARTTNAACGANGGACENCTTTSRTCVQPGSYCAAKLPCTTVCPAGCCDAQDVCHAPTDDACGTKGQTCLDCKGQGLTCAPQGYCYSGPSCGSSSCAGCCTASGQCLAGADTTACGQFGSLCDNCASKNETCRGQVCSSGSTCPGTFAGCSPNAVTAPPQTSTSCTADNMNLVLRSCTGGGANCGAAFMRLLATNPACAGCLSQFVGDQAIVRCLAPFLSQACNHSLTCGASCTSSVCQCPPGETEKCQTVAGQAGGACSAYAYGWSCALTAFQGPGALCNWDSYRDAGTWLSAVGGYYCAAR